MPCPHAGGSDVLPAPVALHSHPPRIALVGSPNVGKSVLFGHLTGRYATVSNYPGTTVAVTQGRAVVGGEVCEVIDTPGVDVIEGVLSEDERATRRILESGRVEVVVQVADTSNLRRALMLTSQLARLGKPMVLVLNMIDEAGHRGIDVDARALGRELGVPVVEAVATEGRGLAELREALPRAKAPGPQVSTVVDNAAWAHLVAGRYRRVRPVTGRLRELLHRAVREPVTGLPILAGVLYLFYLIVGVFGAQTLVSLFEENLFGQIVLPAAARAVDMVPSALVRDFLIGEYGLISMGLTYAVAIVLPIVGTFFLVFGFLEDSGYIPRLAIFSDRLFRTMGLNGRAVLPMVLGLGCDTMATMTTRILGTPKERLIAIVLLALAVPCSAQLATILGILGGISFLALVTLFAVVLAQLFIVGYLAARVLPGGRSDFIMELPPLRWPHPENILRKTWLRIRWYLGEAVPLFMAGTALLFVMDRTGLLAALTAAMEPVVSGLLGLPPRMAGVLVMGFLRRDYGAAGLFDLAREGGLTGVQSLVALTVLTLFMPCVANFLMIVRERGVGVAVAILALVTPIAILTGAGLNHGFRLLGIGF